MFHVGQQVMSKWGKARIKAIEVTDESDRKYGYDVQSLPSTCTFVVIAAAVCGEISLLL